MNQKIDVKESGKTMTRVIMETIKDIKPDGSFTTRTVCDAVKSRYSGIKMGMVRSVMNKAAKTPLFIVNKVNARTRFFSLPPNFYTEMKKFEMCSYSFQWYITGKRPKNVIKVYRGVKPYVRKQYPLKLKPSPIPIVEKKNETWRSVKTTNKSLLGVLDHIVELESLINDLQTENKTLKEKLDTIKKAI